MKAIKMEDLQEVARLILLQVDYNRECGKDDKFTKDEIASIINKRVIHAVISHLLTMKNGEVLPEFDHSKVNDSAYCVEWGIKKGEWIADGIIDKYIEELKSYK